MCVCVVRGGGGASSLLIHVVWSKINIVQVVYKITAQAVGPSLTDYKL